MRRLLVFSTIFFLFACNGQTKEDLVQKGNALRDQGNYRGAVVYYKNALAKDVNYLDARSALAEAYLKSGRYTKAENEFHKVLLQNPSSTSILLKLAKVFLYQGRPNSALLELDKYHSTNSQSAESLTLYGRAQGAAGNFDAAADFFTQALVLNGKYNPARLNLAKIFLRNKKITQARQACQQIIRNDRSYAAAYYLLARIETQNGQKKDALSTYQKLLLLKPKELKALYLGGFLQLDLGLMDAAKQSIDRIKSAFPERAEGNRLQGILFYRQGKFLDANQALDLSIKKQPHPLSYFFLGLSYFGLDRLELALNQFQKALDLNPGFEKARVLVAMTLLKQKRIDDAVLAIQRVLKANPDNAYAHNILGSALLAKGLYDKGMAELDRATEIDPSLAEAHLKRGIFLLAKGEEAQGEADLIKAVTAAPKVMNGRLILVTHYLRQKNYSAAIETLKAGLNGSKDDSLLNTYLAAAYFSQGKKALALKALNAAKKINPKYFTPYFNLANYDASQSDYAEALREYRQVQQLDKKNLRAIMGMASIYSLQGNQEELERTVKLLETTGTERGFTVAARFWLKNKNFSESLAVVERGLGQFMNSVPLMELKGGLLWQLKRPEETEAVYLHLSAISPEKGSRLLLRFYLLSNQADRASKLVETALKTEADKSYPYLLASGLQLAQKKTDAAYLILQKGIDTVTDPRPLQMRLANLYSANRKQSLAEQLYKKVLKDFPRFAPAYSALGVLNEQRGDKGKALSLYEKALQYDRNNISALNNMAYLLTDNFGRSKEALPMALRAYRIQPNDPRIMDSLGYVLLKNKHPEDALALLKKASSLLPGAEVVKLHLAMALQQNQGDKKHIRDLLTQVVDKGAKDEARLARSLLKNL